MNQIVQPLIKIGLFLLIAWIAFPLIGFVLQIALALVLAFLVYKFIKNLMRKSNFNKNTENKKEPIYNSKDQVKNDSFDDNKTVIDVEYKDVE